MPALNRPDLKTSDWKQLRLAILERDAHTCAYCGAEADTVDHIIPASMGVSRPQQPTRRMQPMQRHQRQQDLRTNQLGGTPVGGSP